MNAMVLAAGLGLRMRPLSLRRAKPALPVLNRPLIHWTLERLARCGVREVVINLHHRPASIVQAVGDGRAFGLRVRYSHERTLLGTGGGPRRVRAFFGGDPALVVNGDVLFDFDLGALLARHRASGACATLALKPDPARRYAPVVTRGGRVRSLAGLPRPARGSVSLFTGVHVLDPALLERLPPGPSDSVRDLYAPLLAEGARLLGVRVEGAWYDLGSPAAYHASQLSMLASRRARRPLVDRGAVVARGARVEQSVVGAGALVGEAAVVERSILWEGAVVGSGARVRDAIVAGRVPAGASVSRQVVYGRRRARLA